MYISKCKKNFDIQVQIENAFQQIPVPCRFVSLILDNIPFTNIKTMFSLYLFYFSEPNIF